MGRQHTNRGALLTSNLPQLQNLIKRDPISYRDEFLQQWAHFQSIQRIWKLQPTANTNATGNTSFGGSGAADRDAEGQHFRELVSFIAQVAQCYPNETKDFPNELALMLHENYASLTPELRRSFMQNLVMLRNKDVIGSIDLLRNLFPLLPRTTSSSLRSFLRKTILTDIKTANARTKNHKLNRAVQTMLFTMVEKGMDGDVLGDKGKIRNNPSNSAKTLSLAGGTNINTSVSPSSSKGTEALWAVLLTKELWRKGVWNDAKSVSIVSLGCFHPVAKVQSASLHFFLGDEEDDNENDSSDSEDEGPNMRSLQHKRGINKKTRSGDKKFEKAGKIAKKKRKERAEETTPNFPAIQLLNDPQSFGEKLYEGLVKYDKRYSLEHKLLHMQLLSRVMGTHKLCILGFYTYVLKYLTHHQLRVTIILVSLAQSVHDLTPPDALTPVVRKLAQEFVHPGVGPEVVAAGINAIREICRRQPWCLSEEDGGAELLGDLVEYKKSRDKGVMVAARSLLQLYREVNPGLLKRRERGKTASMGMATGSQPLPYGHSREAAMDIDGLSLLEDHLNQLKANKAANENPDEDMSENSDADEDDAKAWEGWDVESDSSEESDDGGWKNVESDGDDAFSISDSDDEKPKKKEAKLDGDATKKTDDTMAQDVPASENKKISTLATTKILTPADFALLQELRLQEARKTAEAGGGSQSRRKLALLEAQKKATAAIAFDEDDASAAIVTEASILGPRKKQKADYEERMASIAKGREGREKFGSSKGKKNKAAKSSSTNKEKMKFKPMMMVRQSAAVRAKRTASLKDKQKRIRAHIDKAKKAYH